ncbi:putative cytochrome 71A1-like [Capsicum annuum]|nr:putative cytochrome 71A1-like [Capsicum annuum]
MAPPPKIRATQLEFLCMTCTPRHVADVLSIISVMPYKFCQIYDLKPYGIPQLNSAYVMLLSILLSAHSRYHLMSLLVVPWDYIVSIHFWSYEQYGLVHIAAGDLLRAEITAASKNGKHAKKFMDKGKLVPDEIIVTVPEEILVERVVGRKLDPITGKIFNLKYSPPETEEIVSRLTHFGDDKKLKTQFDAMNISDSGCASLVKFILYANMPLKRRNGNQPAPQPKDLLREHVSDVEFRAAFATLAQSVAAQNEQPVVISANPVANSAATRI